MSEPTPDPLALIDVVRQWAEELQGMVAVLADAGFTDMQARDLVVHLITKAGQA